MPDQPAQFKHHQRVDSEATLDLLTQAAQLNYDKILEDAVGQEVEAGPHSSKLVIDWQEQTVYVETTAPIVNLDAELEDEDDGHPERKFGN